MWTLFPREVVLFELTGVAPPPFTAFSPDGDFLASPAGVWDARSGRQLAVFSRPAEVGGTSVAFSQDGSQVAITLGNGEILISDAGTHAAVSKLTLPSLDWLYIFIAIAFSPDGTRFGAVASDGRVAVWDTGNGRKLWESESGEKVTGIAFSRDGRRIVITGLVERARVRDTETGKPVAGAALDLYRQQLSQFSSEVSHLTSPMGRFVLTIVEDEAQLRNASTGKEVMSLGGLPLRPQLAAFSPDGERIAVAGVGSVNLYRCEVCIPFNRLLALARQRIVRQLTASERQVYLHEAVR